MAHISPFNLKSPKMSSDHHSTYSIWGFPEIRGTILGVPIIRTVVFWGLYWGSLTLGNYHILL